MLFPARLPLIGLALAAWAMPAAAGPREVRMMERIERGLVLPEGAEPLHAYTRLYAWADGGRKVRALYQIGPDSRRWVPKGKLATIYDGGCGIIELTVDVASRKIERMGCHGLA